jgi:hypothetical protein
MPPQADKPVMIERDIHTKHIETAIEHDTATLILANLFGGICVSPF